jgi:FixJ family two-component response regulator
MTKKCLISVVDDDQCVRESLKHLIHSMDCYRVASFASAEEYLQSDLVPYTSYLISDYQMPGMTGADLQNRLIAAGYRIPIIFLSANCSEEDRNWLLNDALCVLDKPLHEEILFEWLKRVTSWRCKTDEGREGAKWMVRCTAFNFNFQSDPLREIFRNADTTCAGSPCG